MIARIHVIDPDYRRRARVARELHDRHFHAEIYEDLAEFGDSYADGDVIFAADDGDESEVSKPIQAVRVSGSVLPVVAYASEPKTEKVVAAMLAGAFDYLTWPFEAGALDLAFRRLRTEGEQRLERERRRADALAKTSELTPREREVLSYLVKGCSNKDIGRALHISPRTVEIHRASMMRKRNAQTASDAVRVALYAGLDEDHRPA